LWVVVNADGEIGFWGERSWCSGCLWGRLELLLEAPSTTAECSVGKVRAGGIEAEELVEGDLELVFGESRFHEFDAVNVWQAGNVVKE
jgi:hypothetical protein